MLSKIQISRDNLRDLFISYEKDNYKTEWNDVKGEIEENIDNFLNNKYPKPICPKCNSDGVDVETKGIYCYDCNDFTEQDTSKYEYIQ